MLQYLYGPLGTLTSLYRISQFAVGIVHFTPELGTKMNFKDIEHVSPNV